MSKPKKKNRHVSMQQSDKKHINDTIKSFVTSLVLQRFALKSDIVFIFTHKSSMKPKKSPVLYES